MSALKITSARTLAAAVLQKFNPKKDYASDLLNKHIDKLNSTAEKQRATDLVYGCLRNLSAIDHCVTTLADCPTERIQSRILSILRPAVYELLYCPQTADYAIVNESVETAKQTAGKKQTAFVNAVLRQITRHIKNRNAELKRANPQKIIPQNEHSGCLFDVDILPDTKTQITDYLHLAFSLPKWLIESWLAAYGHDSTRSICFACNRRPRLWLRPNTLKTSPEKFAETLAKNNIQYQFSEDNTMLQVKHPSSVTTLPGFYKGEFTIQDISAIHAVNLLNPGQDRRILDLCAAPGTKTTHLAEHTHDKAEIIATDISAERLKLVEQNTKRLGISSVTIISYEKVEKEPCNLGLFDSILLDVPCSNTGVLSKRIEVRFRITPDAVTKITNTQLQLLETAVKCLKPNGKICYSTCSIQPDENKKLIEKFLDSHTDFKLETEKLTLPSAETPDRDGGYVAIIKRS